MNQRAAILKLLTTTPSPTDAEVDQLTLTLYRAEVAKEVGQIRAELAAREAASRRSLERAYYPYLGPMPKPKIISKTDTEEVYDIPVRPVYKVRLLDLETFCKEMQLDPTAMREVGDGQRKEHRGWVRGPSSGKADERGQDYREPRPLNPKPAPQKRVRAGNPVAAKPITWTPSKGA